MPNLSRFILYSFFFVIGLVVAGIATLAIMVAVAYPRLPTLEILTDYRPRIPLRIYSADNYLIGEFGEERRNVVRFADVPDIMKQAILAIEDDRFYQHGGVDVQGTIRAFLLTILGKKQGGSTITQQVAKNFFLSSERTLERKFYEALLAFKIEKNLSKDQIFELYINQVFLGQKANGFAAASRIYFGKPLKEINVAEAAMLAGLLKSPGTGNPVANPKRATNRQRLVISRMFDLNYINAKMRDEAFNTEIVIKRESNNYPVHAEFVAEMARQMAEELYKGDVYSGGYSVHTTIKKDDQEAAYNALRKNVLNYDARHGYRGAEAYLEASVILSEEEEHLDELLEKYAGSEDLHPALVLEASTKELRVHRYGGEIIKITGENLKLAARFLDDKAPANKKLRKGAVIRIRVADAAKNTWRITQMPEVESAFIALDPKDGSIRALVGGFDFNHNKFNHVTQAWRQPGSSFKPFIYSGALEKGYTPASIIPDEPYSAPGATTGGRAWNPKNYDNKFEGPMSVRTALTKSKNMVSIRLLEGSGVEFIQDYVTRFGFDADKNPPYLTMALGAGSVTPWQMSAAYAIFANGGYKIAPYMVREMRDGKGRVSNIFQAFIAGENAELAIDPRNAFIMDSMMRDVTIYGTAGRASAQLKRRDLAGKTGTTNDHLDAWFCGYQKTLVGCAWIGFDQPKSMGAGETGGSAALPAWIDYMSVALNGVPQETMKMPDGLVSESVSYTGKTTRTELFFKENVPEVIEEEAPFDPNEKPVD